MEPSVGDVMNAQLLAVRKMATEVEDARLALQQWETRLQASVLEAVKVGVPKATVATAAGVSRMTVYSWIDQNGKARLTP